jgi:hypothetical protein
VLEATRSGPQHSPQRPTSERPRTTRDARRQRMPAHHFQPGTALPTRGHTDFRAAPCGRAAPHQRGR